MHIGFGIHSDDLARHHDALFALPCLELENFLRADFADQAHEQLPAIQAQLRGYAGELLISGPYIDLNPATPDRLIREVVRTRCEQARAFAAHIGAREIIFLSTFLPMIQLSFYDDDWVTRSIAFWREFMATVDANLTISLGNTFEYRPDLLVKVAEGVNRPNFKLAFDLGHFLVCARVSLTDWLRQIAPYCSTVYVHSNDGEIDAHLAPDEGVLCCEMVLLLAMKLPPSVRLIAKPFEKTRISETVAWLRDALDS